MKDIFQRMKKAIFQNLANAITAIGIILTIWFISLTWWEKSDNYLLLLLLSISIGISDLDGFLARYLQTITSIGTFLDKFRDKLYACSVFLYFLRGLLSSTDGIWVAFIKGLLVWILIVELFLSKDKAFFILWRSCLREK